MKRLRTVKYILQKEFIQIFRDKSMLPIIILIPIFQLLILSYTATFEIKNIRLEIVDHDHSTESRALTDEFSGSRFFKLIGENDNYQDAEENLAAGKIDQILVIEPGFERKLFKEGKAEVQIVTDAINGSAASLMAAYAINIIQQFNENIVVHQFPLHYKGMPVKVTSSFWYNPELDYITYMVPGILVLLITIVAMFLSSMNIVKEKELGTIEQLNVTPIKKMEFIAGKLIPFWILAMIDLGIGLLLAKYWFGITIVGSSMLLLFVAAVYLILVLAMGLFVSTLTDTMQQAMFISWFVLMIFILMSGLFTPVESMPIWAQKLNMLNPLAYFIKINRMIILKGSTFADFHKDFFILTGYGLIMLTFAILRYRKTKA
ncbi:ABC transporter permease [Candidatus Sulfidibacterium hydrothermale]|uniref:ABC transporter permease n=1 Tax=Candidatus Sulfidibacterium hydrothermale TaxID=2875962 RepID=UPI001F0A77A4|nr:ABC transporter permease [Candidatus Sulfidibacterium hydrothermale]UBM62303.1 ABC transporter permease [Candidatus Sulfidibacterium hydrothermale]